MNEIPRAIIQKIVRRGGEIEFPDPQMALYAGLRVGVNERVQLVTGNGQRNTVIEGVVRCVCPLEIVAKGQEKKTNAKPIVAVPISELDQVMRTGIIGKYQVRTVPNQGRGR